MKQLRRLLISTTALLLGSAMPVYAAHEMGNGVCETTATAGTGTVNLAGTYTPYSTFISQIASGSTVTYRITTGTGGSMKVETGTGTFTDATPDTLTRDAEWTTDDQSAPITELTLAGTSTVCLGTAESTFTGDKGDITFGAGFTTATIDGDSVALTTDTTGNYAAGDGEAGNALTGDSATSFFSSGTIEDARIDGSTEADELVLAGDVDGTANANDIDEANVEVELEGVLDKNDLQGDLTLAGDVDGAHGSNDIDEANVETELEGVIDEADLQVGDEGTDPTRAVDVCVFTTDATTAGNIVCEGDTANTSESRMDFGDPSADRVFTLPDANSYPITDKDYTDITTSASGQTWTIDGDAVALTTDTTGNYVQQVADGTGVDGTINSEGGTYTPTLDFTEVTMGTGLTATGATQVDCDTATTGAVGCPSLATTTEVLTGTDTGKAVTADALAALWEKGSDVASAGTISLGEGSYFHITGTTGITDIDFATAKDGRKAWLIFDGALTITRNATTLELPGQTNYTTAAGDICLVVQDAADNVKVPSCQRVASAPPSGSNTGDQTITLTSDVTGTGTGSFATTIASNAVALGADTTNNYVDNVADGTGIDGSATGETSTYTPTLDLTEINSFVLGAGSATSITWDVATSDPVITGSANTLTISSNTTTPIFILDDQGAIRLTEEDGSGSNYKAFAPPATITSDTTCTFEDDANFIPDSCVGDGSDANTDPANYVGTVADGTGIDGTASGAGSTYTPTIDLTEINSFVLGAGSATSITWDVSTSDPVITGSTNTLTVSSNGTSPVFILDDQAALRIAEEDGGGSNYKAFAAPAAITSDTTCTFEDDANFIPDSCVGDGTDNTGADGLGPDGDKGDITVGGTGTTLQVDADAITLVTDTNGNIVTNVADGTGVDGTCSTENCTYTPTLDFTEVVPITLTLGTGAANEVLDLFNTTDNADVQVLEIEGDRATMTDLDQAYVSFIMSDSAGTQTEYARMTVEATDVTDATEDGSLIWSVMTATSFADELILRGDALYPAANDGLALGLSGTAFADLFLASGGLIEFEGGTTNTLTCTGGSCTIEGNTMYRAGGTDVAVADGGTGASALTDLIALTTHTSGSYVQQVADGTGVDGSVNSEGGTYTPTLDLTEINSFVLGAGSATSITWDVSTSDPVITGSTNTLTISSNGTTPITILDDQGALRLAEEDGSGSNYKAFAPPATITSDTTCTFEDDANFIPDSCVGDGTDTDTNTLGPDGDKGDITVGGTGTTLNVDADSIALVTDTTGNIVTSVSDGTGIDGTCSSENCAYAPSLDLTEINSFVLGAGSATSITWDVATSDPVITGSTNTLTISSNGTTPITILDDQGAIRLTEEDANGSNYKAFAPPATITSDTTCTFEDDANFIPDSCVGDGSDSGADGLGPDGDKGDITVGGTGTTLQVDADAIALGTDTSGTLPVNEGGTGQTTEAEALGEMTQALTEDTAPDPLADFVMTYDASADTGKKVLLKNASMFTKVASGSISAQTNLDIVLTSYSACKTIKVRLANGVAGTDANGLMFRTDSDGGASYDTGASDYGWVMIQMDATDGGVGTSVDSAGTEMFWLEDVSNAAADKFYLDIDGYNLSATTIWPLFHSYGASSDDAGDSQVQITAGNVRKTGDVDAVRFLMNSGTWSTDYALYCAM